jgi:hypothetical protein
MSYVKGQAKQIVDACENYLTLDGTVKTLDASLKS